MKKIRYNKVMKTHKKLLIVAAAVLVVGGAGTGVALAMHNDEHKKTAIEQSAASIEPQNEPVDVVKEQEAVTGPVEQEEQPVEQEAVNPYNRGTSLYYAFEARSSAGLSTPTGQDSDTAFAYDVVSGKMDIETTDTPSLYAIVLAKPSMGGWKVMGYVSSIEGDVATVRNAYGYDYSLGVISHNPHMFRFIP
jgi:hypothetical protein